MNQLNVRYRIPAIVLLLGATLPLSGQTKITEKSVVLYDSIGPVKVGMTVSQAGRALGTPLVKDGDEEEGCYYVVPSKSPEGVAFMVIKRRIVRIDIDSELFATERGARIGDTEQRVKELYKGHIKISEHPYDDNGHYLTVNVGKGFKIIFETDGKRVTRFRVGKSLAVGYIEGCS